tara:strand:- start:48 stop:593 length:546 start_codon:yes stop_codon:yes gene_type:complete
VVGGLIFPSKHLQAALPPERFAEQILEIERELTELHPPWKAPAKSRLGAGIVGSRGVTDMAVKARVKYLLQRRKHLFDGHDWEVVIQTAMGPNGQVQMVAMPIIPKDRHTPASLAAASRTPMAGVGGSSVTQVAKRLGVPVKTAAKLLLDCPAGTDAYQHARAKLAAGEKTKPKTKTKSPA